ncbi:MAG: TonB-dependent receptor [Thermodesulfobacteriaceae bacterium]|nr:TonB-dependent receptor [Thermodesulfobacteriaceae bacterium]
MGRKIFFVLSLLGGFFILKSEVLSQERTELEEVVVTATRIEEPKKEVSSFVQIYTQEEIRLYPGRDVGDLLSSSGIGHIHKYPGVLTTVRIRGMPSDVHGDLYKSQVLYLIDGNRAGTANLAKIPLDDIERIEILKGPASVLYGTQAMGGVVNIITKKAKKEGVQFEAGAEGGSWDYYKGKLELMGKKGELIFYLLGTRSAQNDYASKRWGKIKNSGYDDESFSAKLGYKFLGIHELLFFFQHQKGWKIGSPGARYEPDINDYSDKGRKSYTLSYNSPFLKGSFYFIKDEDEWHGLNDTSSLREWIYYKKLESYGVNLQKDFKLKNLRVLAGGEIHGVKLKTDYLNLPWFYFSISSSEYNSWGVFSEAKIPLFEEKLLLFIGARYDFFKNSFNYQRVPGGSFRPKERNFDHTTLRGGLVYKISKNLSLKTNLGTGFRAPTPNELAMDHIDSYGNHYIGNPSLKAEKSLTWDGGLEYGSPLLNFSFSYFVTNFKDRIISGVPHPTLKKTFTYKNIKGAKIQGLELNLNSELATYLKLPFSVKPFINLTYHTQYRDQEAKASLTYTPKWIGSFGIRAKSNLWNLEFYGVYVGDEKVIDWRWGSPTYRQRIPKKDFTVFNTSLSLKPYKGWEFTLKVENLFNRLYEYVRGYPMPERTFKVGLSYKF